MLGSTSLTDAARDLRTRRPTIALCMIVRNEAQVLERCISSVERFIDAWVICDTGSTDGTPELVESLLGHLPGKLHRRPWRNFGHNRSEALELARGAADYLLLLDADHTVEVTGEIGTLGADQYFLRQVEGIESWLPRLVRADAPFRYVGATHEFLHCDEPATESRHHGLVVVHHGDGGHKADKFERDRALLEAELAVDPENPRSTFYLAQTLECLGEVDAAVETYHRRVVLGGWDEEVFMADYRAAALLAAKDLDGAVPYLMRAWERRPSRREPLYILAREANRADRHHLALLATADWQPSSAGTDRLFVDTTANGWGLAFERTIALARSGRVAEAIELTDHVLARLPHPDWLDADLLINRQHCVDFLLTRGEPVNPYRPAPMVADLVEEPCEATDIAVDLEPGWVALNPSLAVDDERVRLIVRTINYELDAGGNYLIHDPDNVVRTRNFLLELNEDGSRRRIDELHEPRAGRFPTQVRGLEDLRLFRWRDASYVVGTSRDFDPTMRAQLVLAKVSGDRLVDLVPLGRSWGQLDEKNWMPVVDGDRLLFVYSCHPLRVFEYDPTLGAVAEVHRQATPSVLADVRGGAPGVWIGERLLVIGHEVRASGARRLYRHRFILFDRQFRLLGYSRSFSFERYGVEFCAGMALLGTDMLVSYGVEDRAARVMALPLDAVLNLIDFQTD
ncbi:MAG: glycosyltransferase [Nocardiaceae bacterium]|nr:glycosyltransferase [Nocardiaceae bacterium]